MKAVLRQLSLPVALAGLLSGLVAGVLGLELGPDLFSLSLFVAAALAVACVASWRRVVKSSAFQQAWSASVDHDLIRAVQRERLLSGALVVLLTAALALTLGVSLARGQADFFSARLLPSIGAAAAVLVAWRVIQWVRRVPLAARFSVLRPSGIEVKFAFGTVLVPWRLLAGGICLERAPFRPVLGLQLGGPDFSDAALERFISGVEAPKRFLTELVRAEVTFGAHVMVCVEDRDALVRLQRELSERAGAQAGAHGAPPPEPT